MPWRRFFAPAKEGAGSVVDGYQVFDLSVPGALRRLRRLKVRCTGPAAGRDNIVYVAPGPVLQRRLEIDFKAGTGNRLYLGPQDRLFGRIVVAGSNNVFRTEGGSATPTEVRVDVRLLGNRSSVELGAGTTSNGTTIVVTGPDNHVRIGRDCMLSNDIWFRASDMHALIDVDSGEVLNPPADITIGDHVWIGQDSLILKGVSVGAGSVVAAKALVNRSFGERCVIAGVPARVVRRGATWTRKARPSRSDIDAALGMPVAAGDAVPMEVGADEQ
ncbi:acyltransferase [Novispirillum sp. DQ9]|uniref:acyltransferase n=1 Tax=Novispirillum sp. DQ9 TaxID=3398612 RepID=UPI003C7CA5EF